ncbi:MAG: RNA polymerase sigma factor [Bacteroidales bacterium]|nr:RNA polymerase sigma factor [Lentimicrobiaceae bacterium]MDD5694022.1 RNA polymerase sigma factor [Bacteroidales bacterium]
MVPDKKLIEGCLQGKRKASALLYHRYASKMLGVCMRYSRNLTEAEDVLQDGFVKVFTNIGAFRHEGSLEGWIRKIMVNTAVDHYNRQSREAYTAPFEEINELDISDRADRDEEGLPGEDLSEDDLMKMIQGLPDGYRLVFNLYALEGYSHQEIASTLNISINTSKTQLFKARKLLRNVLTSRSLEYANQR